MTFESWCISLAERNHSSFAFVLSFMCKWGSSSFWRCWRGLSVRSLDRWGLDSVLGLVGLEWPRKAFFSRERRICLSWEKTLLLIMVNPLKQSFGGSNFYKHLYSILMCNNYTWTSYIVLYACTWCVRAFSFRRESRDIILGDKLLISDVILSQTIHCTTRRCPCATLRYRRC
jgi:hypothetical protein